MKKSCYAFLVLPLYAAFLFGCDAEVPSQEPDKPSKPTELVLYDGFVFNNGDVDVTAVFKIVREPNGSFKFYVDRTNHNSEVTLHLTVGTDGIISYVFNYNFADLTSGVYSISSQDITTILNNVDVWYFELGFYKNEHVDVSVNIKPRATLIKSPKHDKL